MKIGKELKLFCTNFVVRLRAMRFAYNWVVRKKGNTILFVAYDFESPKTENMGTQCNLHFYHYTDRNLDIKNLLEIAASGHQEKSAKDIADSALVTFHNN